MTPLCYCSKHLRGDGTVRTQVHPRCPEHGDPRATAPCPCVVFSGERGYPVAHCADCRGLGVVRPAPVAPLLSRSDLAPGAR